MEKLFPSHPFHEFPTFAAIRLHEIRDFSQSTRAAMVARNRAALTRRVSEGPRLRVGLVHGNSAAGLTCCKMDDKGEWEFFDRVRRGFRCSTGSGIAAAVN